MSDCANSRMEPYTPKDVCKLRVYFYGQTDPWTYPLALNGRVIKDVMIGETHYVAERTCEIEQLYHVKIAGFDCYNDAYECSECGGEMFEWFKFCPTCGAKVVSA